MSKQLFHTAKPLLAACLKASSARAVRWFMLGMCASVLASCGDGAGDAEPDHSVQPTMDAGAPNSPQPGLQLPDTSDTKGEPSMLGDAAIDEADATDAALSLLDSSPLLSDAAPTTPDGSTSPTHIKKSLVLAWDGVNSGALQTANTPNLDALAGGSWQAGYQGAFTTRAYALTDAPTWSGPNHWAIMTGANASQSGIQDNSDVTSPDSRLFPHYLTLLERAQPTLNTAYLFTWADDLGIDCEADYIKDDEDTPNVRRIVDMLQGKHRDASGTASSAWPLGADLDAVFVFLDDTDHAGHDYGFSAKAPEYIAALERADAQLGEILAALAGRPNFADEDWQIVMTTDHGGTASGHGGESVEEHRIPFLVASRSVTQGELPTYDVKTRVGTRNLDVVPTVLAHFGLLKPRALTGSSRAQR